MADPTGPCPPLEKVSEAEQADTRLADETDADYSAEEASA